MYFNKNNNYNDITLLLLYCMVNFYLRNKRPCTWICFLGTQSRKCITFAQILLNMLFKTISKYFLTLINKGHTCIVHHKDIQHCLISNICMHFLGFIKYAVIIVEILNINVIKEVKLNLHFPLPFSNLVYIQTIR